MLITPSGRPESESMPLVVITHGRGADANDLADIAPYLDATPGYRFLFPNAPNRWEPEPGMTFGFTWFDGLPPVPASLAAARSAVLDFLDAALKRFPTPSGKMVVGGFSQGGLMALDAGLRRNDVAGIVAMSGALYEADLPPLRKDQRVLIVHGTFDEMINVNMARRARRVLEDRGLDPEYHEFAMGHQVTPESLAVVSEFIRSCLAC
ncbi:MAG TPA: alpha/beta fold hydrolase [Thermoanaerobaculia bacterium]|nr:alpha/beta fold hydrolase [Thermoanaerobaculia bacterium]